MRHLSPSNRSRPFPGSLLAARFLVVLVALLTGAAATPGGATPSSQTTSGPVYVVPITGTIDLGLAPYLRRVLDEAEAEGASAVLLEIDTPGGRLDAVLQMRDALLDADLPTIAWVDRTAFSAGALIAIAADRIAISPGSVIGAATPVIGGSGETADAKTVSAVRATFRTTAELRGRDPLVAEAMVDPELAIDGLVARGELLTLTTEEAVAVGYADDVAASRAEVLAANGLAGAPVVATSLSPAERLARFVTDPVVASLLIILAIILIIADFFVEGFGIAGAAGFALLATFFWGHLLAGLAGWEDVALVVVGLLLIAVEVLIVPGFGVPGILGIFALLGGLFLAMLGRDIRTPDGIERAGLTVAASLLAIVLGLAAVLTWLPRSRRLGGLVLAPAAAGGAPPTRRSGGWLRWFGDPAPLTSPQPAPRTEPAPSPASEPSLVGATGTALSDLHPSGLAEIGGHRVDVVTEGDYIGAGDPLEVTGDDQYRRVVRRRERR